MSIGDWRLEACRIAGPVMRRSRAPTPPGPGLKDMRIGASQRDVRYLYAHFYFRILI